jgi:hypothetical protein
MELGGKAHALLLDVNAMVCYEEQMHESFMRDFCVRYADAQNRAVIERVTAAAEGRTPGPEAAGYILSAKEVLILCWACLQHENDPALATPQQVGELMSVDDISAWIVSFARAFEHAMPEPHPEDEPDPNVVSRPAGSNSGPSDGRTSDLPTANSGG